MKNWIVICFFLIFMSACDSNTGDGPYIPLAIELDIPKILADKLIAPIIPIDNPLTKEGVELGRKLFFDPILSLDNSQSCATCHAPENAFTDQLQFSEGVDGIEGTRNVMPLFNLAWNFDEKFTWDGKEVSLESQALEPVSNPIEMHSDWDDVIVELENHPEYPLLFSQAFGNVKIDPSFVTKAIAQFERTLISANAKFDQHLLGQATLSASELNGFNIFMDEAKGDCFHCHGSDNNPLWTDNIFHNNGLDASFSDLGLGEITGDPADNGKFKSPSLRNLKFTAPYMHDGRFATLDDVIDHYSEGLVQSTTIDPLMKKVVQGGVQLSIQDKADLKAFLLTLSDESFINNPNFKKP